MFNNVEIKVAVELTGVVELESNIFMHYDAHKDMYEFFTLKDVENHVGRQRQVANSVKMDRLKGKKDDYVPMLDMNNHWDILDSFYSALLDVSSLLQWTDQELLKKYHAAVKDVEERGEDEAIDAAIFIHTAKALFSVTE